MNRFKIGQKVYLRSAMTAHLNGVYSIAEILRYEDGTALNDRTGKPYAGYAYRLFGLPGQWAESSLAEAH